MSRYTDRVSLPYPSEGMDNWYTTFEEFMTRVDDELAALVGHLGVLIYGGGTMTWTLVTSTLEWSAPITFVLPLTGARQVVPAGSILVGDGDFLLVDLMVGESSVPEPVVYTDKAIDLTLDAKIFGLREGSSIKLSTGLNLGDGNPSTSGVLP